LTYVPPKTTLSEPGLSDGSLCMEGVRGGLGGGTKKTRSTKKLARRGRPTGSEKQILRSPRDTEERSWGGSVHERRCKKSDANKILDHLTRKKRKR